MRRFIFFVLVVFLATVAPVQAQAASLIAMNASVGFEGHFRDNMWTPVLVSLENNGSRSFTGEIVIRPERSRGVTNPVSTPVSLAPDAQQVFTVYVSLQTTAEVVRVELLSDDGLIAAEVESSVSLALPHERLYVRVSDGLGRPVDLSAAVSSGQSALEADWFISNLPDRAIGLEAVDLMLITNSDTGQLTPSQRDAIRNWVFGGGHLIVTGGSRWEETAAGVSGLLPFVPSDSELSSDFGDLSGLAGSSTVPTSINAVIARGTLAENSLVLASSEAGEPLAARHTMGYGLVDYLSFDPASQPFLVWDGMKSIWFSLVSSRDVRPGWSYGFLNLRQGYNAVEILPGVTALPEALAMVGFLLFYVVLIGPVNYFILSRLGRREFAWFSIPALIVLFTIIAWVTGFNLRGTEVVLSRLSVVESWPNTDVSHVRQLIGLLSPRRANYDLAAPDTRAIRPLLRTSQSGFLTNQASQVQVVQTDTFGAVDFPVDASFMAGFVSDGTVPRVPVSGNVTIIDDGTPDVLKWRGSVRNDLPVPLSDVVILSRAGVLRLSEPLAPGEIRILDDQSTYSSAPVVPASPLEYATAFLWPTQIRSVSRGREAAIGPEQSIREIVGDEIFQPALFFGLPANTGALTQAQQRRQTFLANFVIDQFGSTSRGDNIYLLGWTESAPFTETVPGATWRAVDSTLYITQLDTSIQTALGNRARVAPDQFTWTLIEDEADTDSTPNAISYMNRGRLSFRLTPVPSSVLETVDELVVVIEQGSSSLTNTEVRLFNWNSGEYDALILDGTRTRIESPDEYLGPNNAVQIEIDRFLSAGALAITRLAVEQYGTRQG